MVEMIKEMWNSVSNELKFLVIAPVVAYFGYKLALELWCIAYGIGMQLGIL